MDKEQLLYQYFSGTLTPEQEKEFNVLLSSDTEFKAQFAFEQNLQKVIKDKETVDLKSKLQSFETDIKQNSKPIIKLNFQKWSIAASIVLLIGIGWLGYNFAFGTNYNTLYEDNFQQYPNTVYSITRGAEEDNTLERKAFVAYEVGEFKKAILEFDKIPIENRKEYVTFYKAQSYLNLGDSKNAKELFKKNISKNTLFVGESHWYLALIYLHSGEKKEATEELQILAKNYNYKKDTALELLKKLD